ncbi:MAG: (deoxy)nucleoside triphosphate pyrophosphohydrolase [Nitrospirota bacterium]
METINVTAAILEKDGNILIAKRKKGRHLEGKWEFPGGKMEPDENPEECLKRELFEELSIQTTIERFFAESRYDRIRLLAFIVRHISGEFILNVHDEIRWVPLNEIDRYDFAPADIPIVQKLKEEMPPLERQSC